jgi:hypothetical protein
MRLRDSARPFGNRRNLRLPHLWSWQQRQRPFVRLVGDYRVINKYVKVFHFPIPNVIHEIHKVMRFILYSDIDFMNAIHQLRLSLKSAAYLSVQTPFGQFQPKFLPEGVAPASGFLMAVVTEIFSDMMEWIVIVLAIDYQEMYDKIEKVLKRCKERNLIIKLSKSRFGIREVNFFDYVVNAQGYHLSDERKKSFMETPFPAPPRQMKKMQSFLGAANYFKTFVPLYSQKTALLTDMVHKDFSWNESNWQVDYRKVLEELKLDLLHAHNAYHPNYQLEWVLCVDALLVGCGSRFQRGLRVRLSFKLLLLFRRS